MQCDNGSLDVTRPVWVEMQKTNKDDDSLTDTSILKKSSLLD